MGKQRDSSLNSDIISNLPDNIVEKISMHLPIWDTVKTSLLSRKWRYKWTSIPDIVFNGGECYLPNSQTEAYEFVKYIDRVFLLHRGPIRKFELSSTCQQNTCLTCLEISRSIDPWMLFLSINNVKELKLHILTKPEQYKMPSSLFSCQNLTSLSLFYSILKPPPTFNGFRNLKILKLEDITLPNEKVFEIMISNSVLQHLTLINIKGPTRIKIMAPNLNYFYFEGYFSDLCFVNVPHLTYVYINLSHIIKNDNRFRHRESLHFINVLGGLTGVEEFELYSYFFQFLAMFALPRCFQLPISFDHLKYLTVCLNFVLWGEISVIICLLKSAPNLQHLNIFVESSVNKAMDSWEAHDQLDCSMNHLNIVEIVDLSGIHNELKFIKFLLSNSPLLDVLSIKPKLRTYIRESMVFQELLGFPRASSHAKIKYNVLDSSSGSSPSSSSSSS